MGNADKMFEELGFEKLEGDIAVVYVNKHGKNILFAKILRKISITGKYFFIDMEELKAINEKSKELGWNE